jgi:hypothetical protein
MLGPGAFCAPRAAAFIAMASANERYAVHTTEIPMFRLQDKLLKLARPAVQDLADGAGAFVRARRHDPGQIAETSY